jgi:hypothetical protein
MRSNRLRRSNALQTPHELASSFTHRFSTSKAWTLNNILSLPSAVDEVHIYCHKALICSRALVRGLWCPHCEVLASSGGKFSRIGPGLGFSFDSINKNRKLSLLECEHGSYSYFESTRFRLSSHGRHKELRFSSMTAELQLKRVQC